MVDKNSIPANSGQHGSDSESEEEKVRSIFKPSEVHVNFTSQCFL